MFAAFSAHREINNMIHSSVEIYDIADKKLQDKTILATKLSVGTLPEMGYTMNSMVVQKGGVHIARRT